MLINNLTKSTLINWCNNIIGIFSIVIGIRGLWLFIDALIMDVYYPHIMNVTRIAYNVFVASWFYLAALIISGVLLLKRHPKANYLYQLILFGLIIEYIGFKLVLGFALLDNPAILILYLGLLIYLNFPAVKELMGLKSHYSRKFYVYAILLNVVTIALALVYNLIRYEMIYDFPFVLGKP